MSSATYRIPFEPKVIRHGAMSDVPAWFGDYDEDANFQSREFNVFDAIAASGDYFVTIATRLDKIAQGLQQDSAEQIELEHLVSMMFYMQDHYDLIYKFKK